MPFDLLAWWAWLGAIEGGCEANRCTEGPVAGDLTLETVFKCNLNGFVLTC